MLVKAIHLGLKSQAILRYTAAEDLLSSKTKVSDYIKKQ
jgi:hypothetical protein